MIRFSRRFRSRGIQHSVALRSPCALNPLSYTSVESLVFEGYAY